jgi:CO dehydrogenase maturation factor
MTCTIAVAGKGGTGKTTLSSLIVRYLVEKGLTPNLVVDADSNMNLNELLGLEITHTIGKMKESLGRERPSDVTKEAWVQYKTHEALAESEGFDLLAMGRPEGPGCYCLANTLLVSFLENLMDHYRYLIIDNEAGMEHISRLNLRKVNLLLIISDSSQRGILTAGRIRDLIQELHISADRVCLIVNRVPDGLDPSIREKIEHLGLDLAGTVPADDLIYRLEVEGRPTTVLSEDSAALQAVYGIMDEILPVDGNGK